MKTRLGRVWLGVILSTAAVLAGCGGGGGGTGGGGGNGTGGGGTGGGSSSSSSSTSSSGSASPEAPIMKGAVPMEGALHVTWENVTPDCDKIYLDRKHDDGAYATEYTLTGAATSQHDTEAIPPGTYCYKARCEKGGQTSPDSNEKCGTP
jgi:hypothetical protein